MPNDREEERPRHQRPPKMFLQLFGLYEETPEEVYCASCSHRNEGHGVFLFTRYGRFGVDMRNRGRWPNDAALGAWRNQKRIEWILLQAKQCDLGHITLVRTDGVLLHADIMSDSAPPRVVKARE